MWYLLACAGPAPEDSSPPAAEAPPPVDVASPADGWFRGDLHFHTNYSDDALEQGGDWMAGALAIADAWRAPEWQVANPELSPDDHLQFVAVTDHRTTDGLRDPAFDHPYLALLGGEEFGSDGHAGIWGITEHVPHESQAGETSDARMADAIAEAHAQGGLFSVNHPLYSGDLWVWTTEGIDAVEVWNGPWTALAEETDVGTVEARAAEAGVVASAPLLAAAGSRGAGQNAQALRLWQGLLSQGRHLPVVGGGDRHMILPAGLPTTYVMAGSADTVLDGIAAGHTFVSRSPQGPQLVLVAEVDGVRYPTGAALPAGTRLVNVTWTAGRAAGGQVRLYGGPRDPAAPEPTLLAVIEVPEAESTGGWTWEVPATGGWLHGALVDPLPVPPAGAEAAAATLQTFPEDGGLEAILTALLPLVDTTTLGAPDRCDPAAWDPAKLWCMAVDTEPLGTFYVPTALQPYFAVEFEDALPTGYAMGAVTSAFYVDG